MADTNKQRVFELKNFNKRADNLLESWWNNTISKLKRTNGWNTPKIVEKFMLSTDNPFFTSTVWNSLCNGTFWKQNSGSSRTGQWGTTRGLLFGWQDIHQSVRTAPDPSYRTSSKLSLSHEYQPKSKLQPENDISSRQMRQNGLRLARGSYLTDKEKFFPCLRKNLRIDSSFKAHHDSHF